MRKTLIALTLSCALLATQAIAQTVGAPPQISEQDAQSARQTVQPSKQSGYDRLTERAQAHAVNPDLAPTEADYAKARKDRAEGRAPKKRAQGTEIETVRDQNNRITEYVVTPGTTHIPYTVENRADRPTEPGNKDTLGTPKFINFGF